MTFIERNEQLNEAVNRMKRLELSEECISEFLKGNVLVSDAMGFIGKPGKELQRRINDYQLETGNIVYHVTHGIYKFYGSEIFDMFDFFHRKSG